MTEAKLSAFVAGILRAKRIRFGDVRRLGRDILPAGVAAREDAEALLSLHRAVDRADPAWPEFLVAAVRDFVAGSGDDEGDMDDWLARALGDHPGRTGRAIQREVALMRRLGAPRRRNGAGQTAAPAGFAMTFIEAPGLAPAPLEEGSVRQERRESASS